MKITRIREKEIENRDIIFTLFNLAKDIENNKKSIEFIVENIKDRSFRFDEVKPIIDLGLKTSFESMEFLKRMNVDWLEIRKMYSKKIHKIYNKEEFEFFSKNFPAFILDTTILSILNQVFDKSSIDRKIEIFIRNKENQIFVEYAVEKLKKYKTVKVSSNLNLGQDILKYLEEKDIVVEGFTLNGTIEEIEKEEMTKKGYVFSVDKSTAPITVQEDEIEEEEGY